MTSTDTPASLPDDYLSPRSLAEALDMLAGGARPIAGGVEWALRASAAYPPVRLVDLNAIAGLSRLFAHPKIGISIGATVKLRSIGAEIWVAKRWAALHEAVEQIVPPQLHNMATVVGNVCAADPHHDLPVALAAHRASVRIEAAGTAARDVAITDFYPARGTTILRPDELVTAIVGPKPSPDAGSAFRKIGGADKVQAAAYLALDTAADTIVDASLAVGGPSGPIRLASIEVALQGQPASSETYAAAARTALAGLAGFAREEPVRRRWLEVLIRDVLEQAASRARSRHDPFEDHAALLEDQ